MSYIKQLGRYTFRGLVGAVCAYLLFGIASWSLPRDVIDLKIQAPQEVKIGQQLKLSNQFQIFRGANSTYTLRVVCRNGVEIRYFIYDIQASSEPTPPASSTSTVDFPETVEPHDKCSVVVNSTHRVEIMPLFHRTYTDRFESNTFRIVE